MSNSLIVKLTIEECQVLIDVRRSRRESNLGERAYYVLLASTGKSIASIANAMGRHPHTIRIWIKRYLTRGISGLQDKRALC